MVAAQCDLPKNALQYAIVECTMLTKAQSDEEETIAVESSTPVSKSNEPPVEVVGSDSITQPNDSKDLSSHLHISEVMQIPVKVAKFRGEWLGTSTIQPMRSSTYPPTPSIQKATRESLPLNTPFNLNPHLMAVRKSPLWKWRITESRLLYNHDVLKIISYRLIELCKGTEVIDRWNISRDEIKEGYSPQRTDNGTLCHATQTLW